MKTLRFRSSGQTLALGDVVRLAWPGATDQQVARTIQRGRVRVGGVVSSEPGLRVEGGSLVTADVQSGKRSQSDVSDWRGTTSRDLVVHTGQDFWIIDKPAGWASHAVAEGEKSALTLVGEALDIPREQLWPVHRLDADVSGAWLIAASQEAAARLGGCFERGEVVKRYRAIVPTPPWPDGVITEPIDGKASETRFRVVETRGPISLLDIVLVTGRTHQIRRHLLAIDCPILGDRLYEGRMVTGGLRLQSYALRIDNEGLNVTLDVPSDFWPNEKVFPDTLPPPKLIVSQATLKALRRGHPWVLTDTETVDPGRFQLGTVVHISSKYGQTGGLGLAEGKGRISARLWSSEKTSKKPRSIEARVAAALRNRRSLTEDPKTNAYRLIHGEADGLPGFCADRLGSVLRLQLMSTAAVPLADRVVASLIDQLRGYLGEQPPVVRVIHLRDRPKGRFRSVFHSEGELEEHLIARDRIRVCERGLFYEVSLGLDEPFRARPGVGLFMDQRANRERVFRAASGGRWLNLFCHTGAFSVTALAAGADEVVSVDLSAPYLKWLQANLRHNELEKKNHHSVRKDVRRFLRGLSDDDVFDGIILDPPTAAAAGRWFWSVRKEVVALLGLVLKHLKPKGHLLLSRNDRRPRKKTLDSMVRQVADDGGIEILRVENAPPSPDFPTLKGFTEGDPFEGVWVQRG